MRFGRTTAPNWSRIAVTPLRDARNGCLRIVSYPWPGLAGTARRLLFFSDLHFWRRAPERLPLLVGSVNAQEPDWIVFGGDLCRHLTDLEPALAGLADMRARRGKFAVPGNRERGHGWLPPDFWHKAFAQAGFSYLCNETADLGPCRIAGLDDPRHGDPAPDLLPSCRGSGKPVILVWHSPDGPVGLGDEYIGDLVLAGHTHGGQFRLPLFGAIYTSSRYGRQFDRGWFARSDGTRLLVAAGCGETGAGWLRRRLFCPPEIVVLEGPPDASIRSREEPP